eukprot:sb/3467741/
MKSFKFLKLMMKLNTNYYSCTFRACRLPSSRHVSTTNRNTRGVGAPLMQKRVISRTARPLCKKSGSVDSSDRSITPTENEVKENHPKTTNIKPVRTGVIKTPTKQTPTRTLKTPSRLASPRTIKDKVSKTDSPRTPITRSATPKRGGTSPHWKAPSKPQEGFGHVRPLPGRGGPRKQKKVYNPSSLFSLCQGAVTTLVVPSEVSEDVKDVIKRRVYNQAVLGTVWNTVSEDVKDVIKRRVYNQAVLGTVWNTGRGPSFGAYFSCRTFLVGALRSCTCKNRAAPEI